MDFDQLKAGFPNFPLHFVKTVLALTQDKNRAAAVLNAVDTEDYLYLVDAVYDVHDHTACSGCKSEYVVARDAVPRCQTQLANLGFAVSASFFLRQPSAAILEAAMAATSAARSAATLAVSVNAELEILLRKQFAHVYDTPVARKFETSKSTAAKLKAEQERQDIAEEERRRALGLVISPFFDTEFEGTLPAWSDKGGISKAGADCWLAKFPIVTAKNDVRTLNIPKSCVLCEFKSAPDAARSYHSHVLATSRLQAQLQGEAPHEQHLHQEQNPFGQNETASLKAAVHHERKAQVRNRNGMLQCKGRRSVQHSEHFKGIGQEAGAVCLPNPPLSAWQEQQKQNDRRRRKLLQTSSPYCSPHDYRHVTKQQERARSALLEQAEVARRQKEERWRPHYDPANGPISFSVDSPTLSTLSPQPPLRNPLRRSNQEDSASPRKQHHQHRVMHRQEIEPGMMVHCIRGGTKHGIRPRPQPLKSELAEVVRVRVRNGRYDVRFLEDGGIEKNKPITDVVAAAAVPPASVGVLNFDGSAEGGRREEGVLLTSDNAM
jgi:hypothetical protein